MDSEKFSQLFVTGKMEEAKRIVQELLDNGQDVNTILNQGLIKAMDQIGLKFSEGEIFLPEMIVAARCMHACLGILKPILIATRASAGEKIVLGTVKGDLHDIGKNLLGMTLEGGGFEVIDIGVDASAEKFVEAARSHQAKLVCISALLTTTMPQLRVVIEALKSAGLDQDIKTLVGGAPVTASYAEEIGADGYAQDAALAVKKARELLGVH